MATKLRELHDSDFYAWTLDQAQALRDLDAARWNGPLDLSNLAEEVEEFGSERRAAIESHLVRIIEHLLKLDHSPATEPRPGWEDSVDRARTEIDLRLTPTIRHAVGDSLDMLYRLGRRHAERGLRAHGESAAAEALPVTCPYTLEELLGEG